MADEAEVKEEKKGGGNGMMIVLIVLIVVLLAAVGAIGYFLYSKGMFDPEAAPGAKVEQKQEVVAEDDSEEKFQAKVDSLVLNITDAKGRAKLMKLSFTMKTTEPTIEQIVELNKAEIIDAVIRQVSARSSEELLTVGGKAMLKEEMIEEINNILNDATSEEDVKRDSVKDIFFTSFVIK
ncbi:MAG: flagellar basal body-associated FliL family protein [Campylobacterota bacterium]|nr:flagellar basal body-associated FliL family protein [Campylobacterota bacterium]